MTDERMTDERMTDGSMDPPMASRGASPRDGIARGLGWAIVWLALGVISFEFLLMIHGKYAHLGSSAHAMFANRHGWLWTHLAGGGLTLALGPLQFLTRWSRTRLRWHRWAGRLYIGGILVACVGATGLIATSPAPFAIRSAFSMTALAWLTTALMAMIAIRRRQVWLHRRWMIRNYLVTLSPITFRILLQAHLQLGPPSPEAIAFMLWLSWLLPLLGYAGIARLLALVRTARTQDIEARPT
jgi:hypothetical protein